MRRPRAPEGLDTAGAALWRAVTGVYELSPAEVETLRQCCRQVDLIARLDEALRDAPVVVTGSMGQMKAHPQVGAVAEARRTLDCLQRSLNLPMPDESAGHRRSPAAAAAAQARWRGQRNGALA
jgi:phage terminase small subunit